MGIKNPQKKIKLGKDGRKTKWAPIWIILKKYGKGKKINPSATTVVKRHWRRTKLHIKPRKASPNHYG